MVKNDELVDFDIRKHHKHIEIILFIIDEKDMKQIMKNFHENTTEYDTGISYVLEQIDIVNVDFVVV